MLDKKAVGVSFVDVLFALVVARVLEPFGDLNNLTGPGVAHLVLAGFLTLLSWIGYHNSLNRPSFFIRFPNLPLFQFLLDIGMVVVYWLVASTAESLEHPGNPEPEAWPESLLVLVAFGMYVLWDLVARQIRADSRYFMRPKAEDLPARRYVTFGSCAAASLIFIYVWLFNVDTAKGVYIVDALLIALLVAFRLMKEYVTPESYGLSREEREYQQTIEDGRQAHDDEKNLSPEVQARDT